MSHTQVAMHLLTANKQDGLLDAFDRKQRRQFLSGHLLLCRSVFLVDMTGRQAAFVFGDHTSCPRTRRGWRSQPSSPDQLGHLRVRRRCSSTETSGAGAGRGGRGPAAGEAVFWPVVGWLVNRLILPRAR